MSMFFMFFFPSTGSRDRGGKKYINLYLAFPLTLKIGIKKARDQDATPGRGSLIRPGGKSGRKTIFLPRQSVLFISNLNKIVADHDGKL